MDAEAVWDRDLTASEVGRLPKDLKFFRATTFLTRKVELLEAMATDFNLFQTHLNKEFPWKPAGLRRWNIPELGIRAWSDYYVEKHPDRQTLMTRYRDAIKVLIPQKLLADKFAMEPSLGKDAALIAVIEATAEAKYKAIIDIKDLEISNLRTQLLKMMDALRFANTQAGKRPVTSK